MPDIISNITSLKKKILAPYNGLKVTWFEKWHPALDDALQSIPEMEACPHELFRLLVEVHGANQKRVALVTKKEEPVAVVGLRKIGRHRHELVTWVIVPDSVFPAKPGFLMPALEVLGTEVVVGWRRMETPPPPSPLIRELEVLPVYQMNFSDNFEEYWRTSASGHWNTIKKCRKRCQDFTFEVNSPGAAEWVIRNWGRAWNMDPILIEDSVMIAEFSYKQGNFYTFQLLDQQIPVAGHTFMPHRNGFVWVHTYRDTSYDKFGVGTRLMDLTFSWAAEANFETIDLGGRHDYKARWAPPNGEVSIFTICPEPLYYAKQVTQWMRSVKGRLTSSTEETQAQLG
jgi:hypothetical protein